MAQSTRSKTSALGNSSVDKDMDDTRSYHDVSSHPSRKDCPFTSLRSQDNDSEYHSSIVTHDFGLLYPIPSSIKSPQLRLSIGCNFSLVESFSKSFWHFNLLRSVLRSSITNQHAWEFLRSGSFHLHPACDAMFHLKRPSSTSPFNMKIVEENVIFLEYTFLTSRSYRQIIQLTVL